VCWDGQIGAGQGDGETALTYLGEDVCKPPDGRVGDKVAEGNNQEHQGIEVSLLNHLIAGECKGV